MYQKIMVAVDGSETSKQALNEAVRVAALSHGKLHAVYVIDLAAALFPYAGDFDSNVMMDAFRRDGREALEDAEARFAKAGVSGATELVETGHIGEEVAHRLLTCAQRLGADLAVIGTHGRRGVRRAILGSVAERFVRLSECPVLLVRTDDARPNEDTHRASEG
ncbi:universal stress protein [Paraburkholderia sp. FT54]|uniref:universal stress protein n=1 Tax=Paraburkholderia sp. FT54 TaxID=3074437 RepID=UPI0028772EFA|nr:universal stress protein [Paraburkholderia sp. FT54]WNC95062.1 universal stress protein [Paraburkholderia sp. FT54]